MIGERFGENNQIVVIGNSGTTPSGNKLFSVLCEKCAEDSELHGNAIFTSSIGNLRMGRQPCGCSKKHTWTQNQYEILLNRRCPEGFKFLSFSGKFNGSKSKVIFSCDKHGILEPKKLHNALTTVGCFHCRADAAKASLIREDKYHIEKFMRNGTFPDGTIFTRSDKTRPTKGYVEGSKQYWNVYCPVCKETNESLSTNLGRGKVPCQCSIQAQKFAYINILESEHGVEYLKYGITRCMYDRVSKQSRRTALDLTVFGVWEFSHVVDCKRAEKSVKKLVGKYVATKEEFPDGFTETCLPIWLDKIINIYEEHGGVRIEW